MTPIERFRIVDHRREPMPRIVLHRADGAGNGPVVLDAAWLLAQYAVSDTDTLLVLDEDTPFEERLHLALLRGERVIDHLVIGVPYVGGVFRAIGGSADTLRFLFENDRPWTLTVRAEGRRGIGGLPAGARRRTGLLARRYLMLDRPPAPAPSRPEDRPDSMNLAAET
jgi:hypothetical protein